MPLSAADEVPGFDHTRIAAAGRKWDAVRVSRFLGLQALHLLQGREGAVVMASGRTMYFFVPPGSTTDWEVPQSTALGETNHVVLPPRGKEKPPGPYWLSSPHHMQWTDTDMLRKALTNVLKLNRPAAPDLDRLKLDQIRGWSCALCGTRLISDRSLGLFTGRSILMSEPTELWACAPQCRRVDNSAKSAGR